MKQFIYLIIVSAVFGLGFYAGTEKTLGVIRNDNPQDAQVSKLPRRNNRLEMAKNAKDDILAKHDLMPIRKSASPTSLSSSDPESKLEEVVPVEDTTEPVSEKEMTDELLTGLREAGMPDEQINAIAEAMPSDKEASTEQQDVIQDVQPH
jgi:hypothetical protein